MPTIVISYRRADAAGTAGRMFDRLRAHFGDGSVFMDIDSIPAGTNFRQHIRGILTSSDIVLAVIGPRWMGDGGRKRLGEDGDLVCFEVETALEGGIPLIPVLVDHASMPDTGDLPDSLREIADLNAAEVSPGRDFHVHMDRLIRSIEKELAAQNKRKAAQAKLVDSQGRNAVVTAPASPPQPRVGVAPDPGIADPPAPRYSPSNGPRPSPAPLSGYDPPPRSTRDAYARMPDRHDETGEEADRDRKSLQGTDASDRAERETVRSDVPPRRRLGRAVVAVSAIVSVALVAFAGTFALGRHRFEAPGPLERDKVINIPGGLGLLAVADLLRREGVTDGPGVVFAGGALALQAADDLKAGEYLIPKRASLRDVVETMVAGKVVEHPLTIAEGWTSEEITERLLASDILSGNIRELPREGSLLPAVYRFARGTSRESAIQRMQEALQAAVQESWERRMPELPLRTPDQLATLASIVEKETTKPEERTRIAAVLINRLKQNMKLQSDPTVVYGLVGGKGTLGRPILRSEIEQPTPYNTYLIEGLPPGPIANPGRAALAAAANPARTKELYFVADGLGGHVFAETYEQHLRNVARLRGIESGAQPASFDKKPSGSAPLDGPTKR